MAYQPPTTSKYSPPMDFGGSPSSSTPFSRAPKPSLQTSVAFQNNRAEGDWTSFGNKRKPREQEQETSTKQNTDLLMNRNSLSAFVQAVTGGLPSAPEEKWQQSAIRRKPAPEPVKKSYADLFPTLCGGTKSISKSQSTESLSFADLMKKRVTEEEEAKRLALIEEERRAREQQDDERQKRMVGIVHTIYINKRNKVFEEDMGDEYVGDDEDIETDAYGFAVNHGSEPCHSEDEDNFEPGTPPYT